MPSPMIRRDQKYTYADYLTWPDDERWELIDGVPYLMSPAPSYNHQDVAGELFARIDAFLKEKPCSVRFAPHDVRFETDGATDTVVLPDLTIWCKAQTKPDAKTELTVIVEVLSPSTAAQDFVRKKALYEKQGVPEYWIVSPAEKSFFRYVLKGDQYVIHELEAGTFSSELFPGFLINIEEFFEVVDERGQYGPSD